MPASLPDSVILLGAAIKYLEDELLPALSGYHRFKTRVTINVLSTVRRELELRESQAAAELQRLAALIGYGGTLDELNTELAMRIRSGAIAADDPQLVAHVRESLRAALEINNPGWLK